MNDYELIKDLYENNKYVNCDVFVQTLKVGDKAPIVKHKITSQMTYVLKGKGAAIIDGKLVKLYPGKRLDIKQNQTHSMFAIGEDLLLFHVHVPFFTVEEDRYVIQEDINIERESNPMSKVIIWDDRRLFNNSADSINERIKNLKTICSYYVVNDRELDDWKQKSNGDFIVSVGKRPNTICNADINISTVREKNEYGICTNVKLSETDKEKISKIKPSTKKITIIEDFVVEGKTLSKIINEIRKITISPIEVVILGGLSESIDSIKNTNDFVKFIICGPVIDGNPIKDATVLFVSDLLENKRKMLNNEKLMIRCFIDCYKEILDIMK